MQVSYLEMLSQKLVQPLLDTRFDHKNCLKREEEKYQIISTALSITTHLLQIFESRNGSKSFDVRFVIHQVKYLQNEKCSIHFVKSTTKPEMYLELSRLSIIELFYEDS